MTLSKTHTLTVSSSGGVLVIDGEHCDMSDWFASTSRRRASNIEPLSYTLRVTFHLCRRWQRLVAWTRTWPCLWRVNMSLSGGPTFGCYNVRRDALIAEVQWLRTNLWKT